MTTSPRPPTLSELLYDIRQARRVPDWFAEEPDNVLDALHTGILDGQPEKAAELLVEIWPLIPDDVDDDWLRRLHECGVAVAPVLPTSLLLARAFRLGAGVLRARGLLRLAAAQGMRELAVHRLHDDPDATASALADLSTTYRAQGLMHKVIGCADETLETYGHHNHPVGFARTLTHLGSLMIEVGRYDSAADYLTRATAAHEQWDDVVSLALCRALLSRAHRLSGDHRAADRHLNRALAPVVGFDDATAQQVRDLAAGRCAPTARP
ncbi:tetratricopeptide repeat protein [Saccharothrix deserti]|uniref:tetratricopeptide repeat protein n=1 Tax=Saccharothrix deserti TaxID=2593674 RepID=UPI00131AAEC3|nr:tetratricopeptide repeat protein [Saccharothrix deserti]